MTKNVRLTPYYMDTFFKDTMQGKKMFGKYDFFTYTPPQRTKGEGYKPADIANDPTNVPIYDQKMINILDANKNVIGQKKGPNWGDFIRYEGSVRNPIESYGCRYGEEMTMPTAMADKWLRIKVKVKVKVVVQDPDFPDDPEIFIIVDKYKNIMEEVT